MPASRLSLAAANISRSGNSPWSRTAVSEITERLWAEYEGFASRDLSEFDILYRFGRDVRFTLTRR